MENLGQGVLVGVEAYPAPTCGSVGPAWPSACADMAHSTVHHRPPGAMTDLADRHRLVAATTLVVAVAWIVLDQATKVAAVRTLEGEVPVDLGPLVLRVIRNSGGAFSLPLELPWVFVVVAVVVTVLVVRALPETRSLGLATAYGLVVGGAIGNAIDRIWRDGAVVDMLDLDFPPLESFPVFNVADIGITVGAVLVAVLMMRIEAQGAEPAVIETGPATVEDDEDLPPVSAPRSEPPA